MSSLLMFFVWGGVGSETGQKQSVKLLQNMVYNAAQHPPPPSHTLSEYTVRLLWEGGSGGGGQREGRGFTVHKRGRKYQRD
jgi:hypothetical protein